jgi:hypothetical protein
VLLLVASETGHVYTFATPKLQPLITKPEGKNLIQACLNAPDGNLPSVHSTTPFAYPERYGSAPPSRPGSSMSYQGTPQTPSSAMPLPNTPTNSTTEQDSLVMHGTGTLYNTTAYNTSYNSCGLPLSPPNVYSVGYQPNQSYLAQNPQYSHLGILGTGRGSPQIQSLQNASPAEGTNFDDWGYL